MEKLLNWLDASRLAGPIFDRELRACSRRIRYYLLRMIVIGLMLLFLVWGWMMATQFGIGSQGAAFMSSRMSEAARGVTVAVVWMEFLALPLLAVVMCSDAISREINKRTLEVLLSTPITSWQIVTGKLLSRLLQLLLLAGLTLPLFAIIRVFGGVPWNFVLASVCLTLATTGLFGMLSLYFSIRISRAYRVIGLVLFLGILVFGLLPGLMMSLSQFYSHPWMDKTLEVLTLINPYMAMWMISEAVFSSVSAGASVFNWPVHCAIMLGVVVLLLAASTLRLRKTMLALASGDSGIRKLRQRLASRRSIRNAERSTRAVRGHPVLWKELQMYYSQALLGPFSEIVVWTALIVTTFIIAYYFDGWDEPVFHASFVTIMSLIGLLRTATLSALTISREKQSRAWPILLTTPLDEGDILKMKAKAIWRRTAFFWIVIAVDVIVFSACLVLNPFALLGVAVGLVPAVIFLIGVGFYFGMRLKNTTAAMTATFVVPATLWLFCPCVANFSPLMLIAFSVGVGMENEEWMMTLAMAGVSAVPALVYGVLGFVFCVLTKSSMRQYAFHTSA